MSNKEGLTTKTEKKKNKEKGVIKEKGGMVTPEEVEHAMDVIKRAKQQNTWDDGNHFYKKE